MDDLESLEETLHILSDERLVADIHAALAELEIAPAPVLTKDEALALVERS